MGFLNHSTNNIVIDAVLTNKGRKAIADSGGLNIEKFAFSDDEVDYTIIKKYGRIVGKEKIEKNTPIFEASTSAEMGLKYFLNDGDENNVGQVLQTFTLSLNQSAGISGTSIKYNASAVQGTTTSFTVVVTEVNVDSNLQSIDLAEDYTTSFDDTFLSNPNASDVLNVDLKPAVKSLTQYHNSNQQLVLPITVRNGNGFEQTIFVTINPFAT